MKSETAIFNRFLIILLFLLMSGNLSVAASLEEERPAISADSVDVPASGTNFTTSREESLYIELIHRQNSTEYLDFISLYPESHFTALLACRYLLLELGQGSQVDILIRNLNQIGLPVYMTNLYPMIRNKPDHLIRAAVFPAQHIRMWIKENYSGQLEEDPYVEWNLEFDRWLHIPFDALHLVARHNYFRMHTDHIQFLIADSAGLNLTRKIFHQIVWLMEDFCRSLDYASLDELFSEVLDRRFTMYGKLTVMIYDPADFQKRYLLKKAGWSYPHYGLIFINPTHKTSQDFLEILIHKISHIFLAGNRHDIHYSGSRWFDEGFAQWAGWCYLNFQQLLPKTDSYQSEMLKDRINKTRLDAVSQLREAPKYIKLSAVNQQSKSNDDMQGEPVREPRSLSLIAYLVETYGAEKVIQAAARISRRGQNFTEESLKVVLKTNYDQIEQGWNQWLQRTTEKLDSMNNDL